MSAPPPLITLLTDFGLDDAYVGQMKGAILAICPHARIVDLTHAIPPGRIEAAARIWADSFDAFPVETVHVAVVDPGVGSARRPVAAKIGPYRFVCPDNGLLTGVLERWPLEQAVELTESRWWRPEISPVFHGRDIFGPVAAHWATGRLLTDFGPAVDMLVTLSLPVPTRDGDRIRGMVIGIDRFGNLQTNIPADMLAPSSQSWMIQCGGEIISGVHRFYAEQPAGTLMALIGSNNRLEIAVPQGHAAQRLGVSIGEAVLMHAK